MPEAQWPPLRLTSFQFPDGGRLRPRMHFAADSGHRSILRRSATAGLLADLDFLLGGHPGPFDWGR